MAKKINIAGTLNASTTDGVLGFANQIKDEAKRKMQSVLNQEFEAKLSELGQEVDSHETRLAAVEDLTSPTLDTEYTLSDFVDGFYVVANKINEKPSQPTALANYAYMYKDTIEGDKWEIKLSGGSSGRAWALVNADGLVVDYCEDSYVVTETTITIPSGVTQILFQTEYSESNKGSFYVKKQGSKSKLDKRFEGVESRLQECEDAIDDIQDLTSPTLDTEYTLDDFVDGYYIVSNKINEKPSQPTALANFAYMYKDTQEGDVWGYKLRNGSTSKAWALINKDGLIVDYCNEDTYTAVEGTITIPNDIVQVLFQTDYSESNKSDRFVKKQGSESKLERRFNNVESRLQECEDAISELKEIEIPSFGGKEYTLSDFVDGYYVVSNNIGQKPGNPIVLANYAYMYQDTQEGDVWAYKLRNGNSGKAWALLDSNGLVIDFCNEAAYTIIEGTITIPSGVVRVLFQTDYSEVTKDSFYVMKKGIELMITELQEDVENIKTDINGLKKGSSCSLKVLCFGNSFTQDSMSYVPYILKNIAPQLQLTLGIAYIGGCSLVQHLASFTGETQSIGDSQANYSNYSYYKSINGEAWTSLGSKSPDDMIADEDWDIITFQQSGTYAANDFDTYYAPYIYKLHKSLFDKLGKNIKLGWLLIHGTYASGSQGLYNHWKGTAENSKTVIDTTGTSILFPYGTAVQNLRTTSLESLGNTGFLLADGGHLHEGIGCLTAAYANALTMLNCVGLNSIGVIGDTTRIDATFVKNFKVPGPNPGSATNEEITVVGITDDNCYLAQVAAECALKNPYEVTDLTAVEGGL